MSHVSHIDVKIRDLAALKKACEKLGFEFVENQKTYAWYGTLVEPDKYPLPEGLTVNDLGHCDHAIKIPTARYEIGVLKRNGNYMLLCDYWDNHLRQAVGENGGLLKQQYVAEVIRCALRKKHLSFVEKNKAETGTGIEINITM